MALVILTEIRLVLTREDKISPQDPTVRKMLKEENWLKLLLIYYKQLSIHESVFMQEFGRGQCRIQHSPFKKVFLTELKLLHRQLSRQLILNLIKVLFLNMMPHLYC